MVHMSLFVFVCVCVSECVYGESLYPEARGLNERHFDLLSMFSQLTLITVQLGQGSVVVWRQSARVSRELDHL